MPNEKALTSYGFDVIQEFASAGLAAQNTVVHRNQDYNQMSSEEKFILPPANIDLIRPTRQIPNPRVAISGANSPYKSSRRQKVKSKKYDTQPSPLNLKDDYSPNPSKLPSRISAIEHFEERLESGKILKMAQTRSVSRPDSGPKRKETK